MQRRRTLLLLLLNVVVAFGLVGALVLAPARSLQFILNHTGHHVEGLKLDLFSTSPEVSVDLWESQDSARFVRLKGFHISSDFSEEGVIVDLQADEISFRDLARPSIRLRDELSKLAGRWKPDTPININEIKVKRFSLEPSASSEPLVVENLEIKNLSLGDVHRFEQLSFQSNFASFNQGSLELIFSPKVFADLDSDLRATFRLPDEDAHFDNDELQRVRERLPKASPGS